MKIIATIKAIDRHPFSYSSSSDGVFSLYQSNGCFNFISHSFLSPFEEITSTIQPHFVHFLCALLGLFIHLCPFLFSAPNFVPLLNPIITPFPVNIYELADIHIVYTEILGSFLVTIRKLPFKSACITNHQTIIFITSITP